MRPLSWLTLIGSLILSLPMILWTTGLNATMMMVIHISGFLLILRLLFLAATVAESVADVMWVGGYSGLTGSLVSQLLLHLPTASAGVAVAFASYGHIGASMYRLDELTPWWPFLLTLWSGGAYAFLGRLMFILVRSRRQRIGYSSRDV